MNILIIRGESILFNVVQHLISREKDLITRIVPFYDPSELTFEISNFKPEVVIIEDPSLVPLITSLVTVLEDVKEWCIILVDHRYNLLHVYSRKEVCIFNPSDLVATIRNNFDPQQGSFQKRRTISMIEYFSDQAIEPVQLEGSESGNLSDQPTQSKTLPEELPDREALD